MRLDSSARLRVIMLVVVLFICCYIASCASWDKGAFRTMSTIAVGVNATMDALDEMYSAGYISEETKDKIVEIHKSYRASHRALVTALQVYKSMEGNNKELQKDTIERGMADLQVMVAQLSTILLESKDLAARDE